MANPIVREDLAVPATLEAALDPAWLTEALRPLSGGRRVLSAVPTGMVRTMATKLCCAVQFEGEDAPHALALKAFLDVDEDNAGGGATTVREADFYALIAPHLTARVPLVHAMVIDRAAQQALIVMPDLVAAGARFCSAREAFSADEAAQSLSQYARLHAASALLEGQDWIGRRIATYAERQHLPLETLQAMMHGERNEGLPDHVRDAGLLVAGLKALAARDEDRPATLLHGDCHAGNLYWSAEGPGLIDWQLVQRGGWALDVAYHIAAVLPVAVAEAEERHLLRHYLGELAAHGGQAPDEDTAWALYRESALYGFYLWSITRRVEPDITQMFCQRLGAALARHDAHRLLGVR